VACVALPRIGLRAVSFLMQVLVSARAGRPHPRAPWPRPRHQRSSARRRSTPRLARDDIPRPCRPSSLGLSVQERARLGRPEHTPELWTEAGNPSRRRVCERRVVLTAPC
jgi:hypothetical protein